MPLFKESVRQNRSTWAWRKAWRGKLKTQRGPNPKNKKSMRSWRRFLSSSCCGQADPKYMNRTRQTPEKGFLRTSLQTADVTKCSRKYLASCAWWEDSSHLLQLMGWAFGLIRANVFMKNSKSCKKYMGSTCLCGIERKGPNARLSTNASLRCIAKFTSFPAQNTWNTSNHQHRRQ